MPDEGLSKLKIEKTMSASYGSKRKRPFYIGAALIILLLIVLFVAGVFTPAVDVQVFNVSEIYPSQTFTLLNASGYVVAQRKAAVASKITSQLVSLSVEEGDLVKKGDVIARLESEDTAAAKDQAAANLKVSRANLEQAKAELHDAEVDFRRQKELVEKGFISRLDYDAAEARYKKAVAAVAGSEASIKASTAALRNAEVSLGYSVIRAPFDAVVLTKDADVGDIVTPLGAAANAKASVVTLADMSSLQVEVDVSESNLEKVKMGQPCEIQLDALPESRFRGEVHMIVPTADRTKATVMVKVKFLDKDKRILPEMSAKVAFLERQVRPEETKPFLAVNGESIIVRKDRKAVFLIKGNRVSETTVTTGEQIGNMVAIMSGLKAGDKIVAKPSGRLKDGARIKIVEK